MKKTGFTLTELLVSITIVAVVAGVGYTTYGNAQLSSRDSKRKQDLASIATALELYYAKNNRYPDIITMNCAGPGNWCLSNATQPWIPSLNSDYLSKLPTDPKSNGGYPWGDNGFGYAYWSHACGSYAVGQFYALVTQLENKSDRDRNELKNYKWCDSNGLYTTYNWSRYSYIITSNK